MGPENTNVAPAVQAGETVPGAWPGAFGLYKFSKRAVLNNWQTLLAIILLSFVASFVISMIGGIGSTVDPDTNMVQYGAMYYVMQLVNFLVAIALSVATTVAELRSVDGKKLSLSESFAPTGKFFVRLLLQMLLIGLIAIVSFVLLIVPFFIVMPRLVLAPYFMIDKDMGVMDSIKASWEQTKGNVGKVYGIFGATLLMMLLMITIIGIPFALYFLFMYSLAFVVLYRWVGRNQAQAPAGPVAATPVAS